MDSSVAEATSVLLLKVNAALDSQLARLQTGCTPGEFNEQRRLFGSAMAALLDILNPIYRAHPSLKPTQLGGSYVLPSGLLEQSVARLVNGA